MGLLAGSREREGFGVLGRGGGDVLGVEMIRAVGTERHLLVPGLV